MRLSARRALTSAAAAAIATATLTTFAGPALADYQPGQLSGSVTAPTDNQVLTTATPRVQGEFGYATQLGQPTGTVTEIDATIVANAGQTVPAGGATTINGSAATLAIDWTAPALPYNGAYTAHVVAKGRAGLQDQTATVDRAFSLAVPPAAPANVTATYDAATGKITVGWTKNPEPDLVAYGVQRAAPNGSFSPLATVDAPATKYVDAPGPGDWRYTVVAIRKGATPDAVLASPDSSEAKVTEPAPTTTEAPPGASSSSPGSAGSAGGSSATGSSGSLSPTSSASSSGGRTSAAAAPNASVDLNSFSALLNARRTPTTTPPKAAEPADPGYQPTLPFKPKATNDKPQPQLGPPDEPALVGFANRILDDGRRRAGLTGIAGFLVLFVMMMQMRWVLGQAKASDLDALPVEGGDASGPTVDPAPASDLAGEVAPDGGLPFEGDVPFRDIADLAALDDGTDAAGDAAGPTSMLPVVPAFVPLDAPGLDVPQPARRRSRRRLADAGNTVA